MCRLMQGMFTPWSLQLRSSPAAKRRRSGQVRLFYQRAHNSLCTFRFVTVPDLHVLRSEEKRYVDTSDWWSTPCSLLQKPAESLLSVILCVFLSLFGWCGNYRHIKFAIWGCLDGPHSLVLFSYPGSSSVTWPNDRLVTIKPECDGTGFWKSVVGNVERRRGRVVPRGAPAPHQTENSTCWCSFTPASHPVTERRNERRCLPESLSAQQQQQC